MYTYLNINFYLLTYRTIKQLKKEMGERRSDKKNTGTNGLQEKLKNAQDEIDELKNRLLKSIAQLRCSTFTK